MPRSDSGDCARPSPCGEADVYADYVHLVEVYRPSRACGVTAGLATDSRRGGSAYSSADGLTASGIRSSCPMLRILVASSAAHRLHGASEFLKSLPDATEALVASANRGAADDLVRSLAADRPAT